MSVCHDNLPECLQFSAVTYSHYPVYVLGGYMACVSRTVTSEQDRWINMCVHHEASASMHQHQFYGQSDWITTRPWQSAINR